MPITLPPLTRRRFIKTTFAAGAAAGLGRHALSAEQSTDAARFALLADTHINGNRETVVRGVHLATHLQNVIREISDDGQRPRHALIAGDCTHVDGQSEDYSALADLLAPARKTGTTVHLALGNHDHRGRALKSLTLPGKPPKLMADRHVSVVGAPLANWFILDSLDIVNKSPGKLGEAQLAWLDTALAAKADKPALVIVHHNPDRSGKKKSCLLDTKPFFGILGKHRHVKAYVYGHTHNWGVTTEPEGLHLVNLPPVAYTFGKGRPSGWVNAELAENGIALTLRCLDKKHAQHGKTVSLKWRAG